jgi:rare lipoprotein A
LGPVTTLAVGNSPVQALSSVDAASPIVTAPPAAISIETQVIRESYPLNPPIEEKINAPDTRVQLPTLPAPVIYPGPAAVIKGGIPPENSAKSYRLQVGSFKVPKNAADVFDRLKKAGLNPAYEERKDDFYRVVLPGLKAEEIPSIAQTLGNSGFREAIIREEN